MKKLYLGVITIFVLAVNVNVEAQNSVKKDKIKTLFALMHQDSLVIKTIDAMTVSMTKNMSAMFKDSTFQILV